jgi:hypothetical protein
MTEYHPTEGLGDEVERIVLHMGLIPGQREMIADALMGEIDLRSLPPRLREAADNLNHYLDEIERLEGADARRLTWLPAVVGDLTVPEESKGREDMSPDELERYLEWREKYPDPESLAPRRTRARHGRATLPARAGSRE